MYKVKFYQDRNGNQPVLDYLRDLYSKPDKNSRIRLQKINDYIEVLKIKGTRAGEPYVKHLEGEIWELRPLRDRILFVGWIEGTFVLLHHFKKDTKKTPRREIEQARRNLADLQKRSKIT